MPALKVAKKNAKGKTTDKGVQLDIVFDGPLLFVPTVSDGNVTGLEVYSPCNGHPIGAVFVPGVWYSDEELSGGRSERWPEPESFSLLDPHSYSIDLTQQYPKKGNPAGFPAKSIPEANHKVRPGRRLSGDWNVAIAVRGEVSAWTSPCVIPVPEGMFSGSDAPTAGTIALTHKLTYSGVTAAEFCGAPTEAKEYLAANCTTGGTLIILGELPYHPTLLHERQAIDAIAKLAGLDLRLMLTAPTPGPSRVMSHIKPCATSIVLV